MTAKALKKMILPIGNNGNNKFENLKQNSCRLKNINGFTLIEILVVMVIISVMAGFLVIKLLPDDTSRMRKESQRLVQVLSLAADYARLSGKKLAWSTDGKKYFFLAEEVNSNNTIEWKKFVVKRYSHDTFTDYELPGSLSISQLEINNQKFSATDEQNNKIYFYPSAINPSFIITLSVLDKPKLERKIAGSPIGRVSLVKKIVKKKAKQLPTSLN